MRNFVLVVAWGMGAVLAAGPARAAAADVKNESGRVAQLIGQLGHDAFAEREKAMKELEVVGPPALQALRESVNSPDAEVKRRSRELVQKIEKRVEAERILAPTKIRLSYKDVPVTDAIADLATKGGVTVGYRGDRAKLAERRITLDTGEVPFWQALDQFCQKAGLTEAKEQTTGQAALQARRGGIDMPIAVWVQPPQVPGALPVPAARANRVRASTPPDGRPMEVFRPTSEAAQALPAAVVLEEGESAGVPSYLAGAVRIRAGDQALTVAAEPKIPALSVKHWRIDKAVDDRGQSLTPILSESQAQAAMIEELVILERKALVMAGNANRFAADLAPALRETVPLRFKPGDMPSKRLKDLTGVLTLQVRTPPEPMITVDNVLKATGKTTKGAKGGSIIVHEATQYKNGTVSLKVDLELPPDITDIDAVALGNNRLIMPANANIQLVQQVRAQRLLARRIALNQGMGVGGMLLESEAVSLTLLDAKGERFQQTQSRMQQMMNNGLSSQYVLTFQAKKGQGEPAKLVFSGSRTVTLDVPFELHDIKLP